MLNADRERSDLEAVDLQALGLNAITAQGGTGRVRIGATATLDAVRRCDRLPGSLRDLARAEQPSTLRTLATVGGLVAKASGESLLLAALLAHDGRVECAGAGSETSECSLAELLAAGLAAGTLITAVTLDGSGKTAVARTGRTPADVPIVAAYGRRTPGFVDLALTGVAEHPVLVDVYDPTAGLDPAGDFRGSPEYRLHLARTLTARVMAELSSSSERE